MKGSAIKEWANRAQINFGKLPTSEILYHIDI